MSTTINYPTDVLAGNQITKEKRHELFGRVSGGSGSQKPEEFQRKMVFAGTGIQSKKTNMRVNLRTYALVEIATPNRKDDGFDYSENFDGVQILGNKRIYLNFKCIVGKGGSQTRSLREVYWFIQGQLHILNNSKETKSEIYFANILDGDEAHSCMSKFQYMLSLDEFVGVKNKIYIGDLKGYFEWFQKTIADE